MSTNCYGFRQHTDERGEALSAPALVTFRNAFVECDGRSDGGDVCARRVVTGEAARDMFLDQRPWMFCEGRQHPYPARCRA